MLITNFHEKSIFELFNSSYGELRTYAKTLLKYVETVLRKKKIKKSVSNLIK